MYAVYQPQRYYLAEDCCRNRNSRVMLVIKSFIVDILIGSIGVPTSSKYAG